MFSFYSFRVEIGKKENKKKSEIQVYSRHQKGDMSIKEQNTKKIEATKTGGSDFINRMAYFFRIDRV
jgi:hypothetical protein